MLRAAKRPAHPPNLPRHRNRRGNPRPREPPSPDRRRIRRQSPRPTLPRREVLSRILIRRTTPNGNPAMPLIGCRRRQSPPEFALVIAGWGGFNRVANEFGANGRRFGNAWPRCVAEVPHYDHRESLWRGGELRAETPAEVGAHLGAPLTKDATAGSGFTRGRAVQGEEKNNLSSKMIGIFGYRL